MSDDARLVADKSVSATSLTYSDAAKPSSLAPPAPPPKEGNMKTVTEYRNMPMIQEFIAGGAPAHLIEKLIDAFILGDVQDERNGTSGMSIMECVAEDIPMPQASELAFDLIDEIRAAMPQRTLQ